MMQLFGSVNYLLISTWEKYIYLEYDDYDEEERSEGDDAHDGGVNKR